MAIYADDDYRDQYGFPAENTYGYDSRYDSMGTAVVKSYHKGWAELARNVSLIGGAFPVASDFLFGTEFTDPYFENVTGRLQDAADYWTPSINPESESAAIVAGLAQVAPTIIGAIATGGAAPAVGGANIGLTTTADLLQNGVDSELAYGAGAINGLIGTAAFFIPAAFGTRLGTRIATGTGANAGLGIGQNAITAELLEDDYPLIAQNYAPSMQSFMIDALMGAAFGAGVHYGGANIRNIMADNRLDSGAATDAILALATQKHFEAETAAGVIDNKIDAINHNLNMRTAFSRFVGGESELRNQVAGEIIGAYRNFSPDIQTVAVTGARITTDFYTTLANDLGKTVEEVYRRYPLHVMENETQIANTGLRVAQIVQDAAAKGVKGGHFLTPTELTIRSQFKLRSNKPVTDTESLAQAVDGLMESRFEQGGYLITDENGTPLAILGNNIGSTTSVQMPNLRMLLDVLPRIKGAKNVWDYHVHPQGNDGFSPADRKHAAETVSVLKKLPYNFKGAIAIGRGKGNLKDKNTATVTEYDDSGRVSRKEETIEYQSAQGETVVNSVGIDFIRPVAMPDVKAFWATRSQDGTIKNGAEASERVQILKQLFPEVKQDGLLFVDFHGIPIGYYEFDAPFDALSIKPEVEKMMLAYSKAGAYRTYLVKKNAARMSLNEMENYANAMIAMRMNQAHGGGFTFSANIMDMDSGVVAVPRATSAKAAFYDSDPMAGIRGQYTPQEIIIRIAQNGNRVTFFHELGHFFLDIRARVAQDILTRKPETWTAGEKTIVEDMNVVFRELGTTLDDFMKMDANGQRPYQEKFTDLFLSYLEEGKAPKLTLRKAFETIKTWFKEIVAQFRNEGLVLSDDLRRTFDRMLASEKEISVNREFQDATNGDFVDVEVILPKRVEESVKQAKAYQKSLGGKKKAMSEWQAQRDDGRTNLDYETWLYRQTDAFKNSPVNKMLEEYAKDNGLAYNPLKTDLNTLPKAVRDADNPNEIPLSAIAQDAAVSPDMQLPFIDETGQMSMRTLGEMYNEAMSVGAVEEQAQRAYRLVVACEFGEKVE